MFSTDDLPEGSIPLGPNNWYSKSIDPDGVWIGINEYHRRADEPSRLCGGWVPFNVESEYLTKHGEKWTVNSFDPLDMTPSLLCTICGSHGYIREGRWVPA